MISVCMAGITGTVGRRVAEGIAAHAGLRLVAGVARSTSGCCHLQLAGSYIPVFPDVTTALDQTPDQVPDVLLDLTEPAAAKRHAEQALSRQVRVIVAATDDDTEAMARLGLLAARNNTALAVIPNLSITMAWLEILALCVAASWPEARILDRAAPGVRAPLRTTTALSRSLARAGAHATLESERRDGLTSEIVVTFPAAAEQLQLAHSASSEDAYVAGAILAVRKVMGKVGLLHGLTWALDE